MPSSTSNSDKPIKLLALKLFLGVCVILLSYYFLIQTTDSHAIHAETNMNAGMLRIQYLENSKGRLGVLCGSSISGKMQADLIFNNSQLTGINLGIDGGSPLYAAEKLLESNKDLGVVLIEANLMLKPIGGNSNLIDQETESFWFNLSNLFPVLGREYRPASVLYSKLKMTSDARRAKTEVGLSVAELDLQPVDDRLNTSSIYSRKNEIYKKWYTIVNEFKKRGVRVAFVMFPDGRVTRDAESELAYSLSDELGVEYYDLKSRISAKHNLGYTDGLHLVRSSAEQVSSLLNHTLYQSTQ